jgi:hypothetical protein
VTPKLDRKKMKKDLFIAHLRSFLNHQYQEMREYFETMQFLFKSEEKRDFDRLGRETAKLSPEEQDQFVEWYGEDFLKIKRSIPTIHRTAIFFTIYSKFEDALKLLCQASAAELKIDTQQYKWRGGIIEMAQKCLEQNIGIETLNLEKLWNDVKTLRKIRNTLIHNDGWLYNGEPSEAKAIDCIINKFHSINLDAKKGDKVYRIELSDAFIFEVMDIFNRLLNKLFSNISDRIRREIA